MLSILCISRLDPDVTGLLTEMSALARDVKAEFVIAADGKAAFDVLAETQFGCDLGVMVQSRGFLESVLEQALEYCRGDYILRLDDDERASDAMARWLKAEAYMEDDHWKFARAHLWGDRQTFIPHHPLWEDHQTRLSTREKSGNRHWIHCGSPFGGGRLAPVAIEHHKFLVKSKAQREETVRNYDRVQPGAGTAFMHFQLPEVQAFLTGGEIQTDQWPGLYEANLR